MSLRINRPACTHNKHMDITTIIAIAVALGTDAFSMCVGLGMAGVTRLQVIVVTLAVMGFHIVMPLTGYYAGDIFGHLLGRAANIIGALVLVYLGIRMIRGALRNESCQTTEIITANRTGLLMLAGSVSLDALSVGFTLGTQRVALGTAALVMGLVAGAMTLAGLAVGQRVGGLVGEKAVFIGGAVLIVIGIKLLF
ncbi:MAG: manganese efflux pump MntP family protein [Bacillota bacterium]